MTTWESSSAGSGSAEPEVSYRLGDDVVHASFGDGVVTGVEPGGIVVIRFAKDRSERKLMADVAPITKRSERPCHRASGAIQPWRWPPSRPHSQRREPSPSRPHRQRRPPSRCHRPSRRRSRPSTRRRPPGPGPDGRADERVERGHAADRDVRHEVVRDCRAPAQRRPCRVQSATSAWTQLTLARWLILAAVLVRPVRSRSYEPADARVADRHEHDRDGRRDRHRAVLGTEC